MHRYKWEFGVVFIKEVIDKETKKVYIKETIILICFVNIKKCNTMSDLRQIVVGL